MKQALLPEGWRRPKGFPNGVSVRSRHMLVAGMIGWDANEVFHTDDFAGRAARAIEAGASWRVIPWQMAIVARIMRLLPDALYDRLASGRGRKHRRDE